MPIYTYRCNLCGEIFEKKHSFKDKIISKDDCNKDCQLERIPSSFFVSINEVEEGVGHHVKRTIEETKEDLKESLETRKDYE